MIKVTREYRIKLSEEIEDQIYEVSAKNDAAVGQFVDLVTRMCDMGDFKSAVLVRYNEKADTAVRGEAHWVSDEDLIDPSFYTELLRVREYTCDETDMNFD